MHNTYLYISENIPLPGGGELRPGKEIKGEEKRGQKREKGRGRKKGAKKGKRERGKKKRAQKKGKEEEKREKGKRKGPRTHPKWLGPSGLGDVSALRASEMYRPFGPPESWGKTWVPVEGR